MDELPEPTTSVRRPAYGPGLRYSEVKITGGRKLSGPARLELASVTLRLRHFSPKAH
jgi:hypothetical protein